MISDPKKFARNMLVNGIFAKPKFSPGKWKDEEKPRFSPGTTGEGREDTVSVLPQEGEAKISRSK